ncbi:hypothetical protein J2T56_000227 [Natronobacillus azotifigens]
MINKPGIIGLRMICILNIITIIILNIALAILIYDFAFTLIAFSVVVLQIVLLFLIITYNVH